MSEQVAGLALQRRAELRERPRTAASAARAIYTRARPMYHSVSYRTIDQILKWA